MRNLLVFAVLFLALSLPSKAQNTLLDGLVSHWKLDGPVSGVWPDSHGTNDLQVVGTVSQGIGKFNGSAVFNGDAANYLRCADNESLRVGQGSWTIGMWAKITNKTTDSWWGQVLAGKGNDTAFEYNVFFEPQYDRYGGISGGSWSSATGPNGAAPLDEWCSIIVKQDDSTYPIISIYAEVNGAYGSYSSWQGIGWSGYPDLGGAFTIGGWEGDSTAPAPFNGEICSVSLWKRALTATEILRWRNGGAGLPYPFD